MFQKIKYLLQLINFRSENAKAIYTCIVNKIELTQSNINDVKEALKVKNKLKNKKTTITNH